MLRNVAGYEVIRPIASGGMAEVYEARHPVTHRRVALKVMRGEHREKPASRERFLREVRTMGALAHEHIVGIIDAGTADDGRPFLVMDLVVGESLRSILDREGSIAPERACRIALQIGRALISAHEQKLVHRDLKPGNVLVRQRSDGSEHVLVIDFGISRTVEEEPEDTGLTSTGGVLGTPNYMSPEQARGEPNVGPKTDVYALGAVLYEMLIGSRAHSGETRQAVLHHVLYHRAPSLPDTLVGSFPELGRLIRGCLKKKAEQRPDAAQVVATLERCLVSPPLIVDASVPTFESVALPRARSRWRRSWLALASLGAGAVLGWNAGTSVRDEDGGSEHQLSEDQIGEDRDPEVIVHDVTSPGQQEHEGTARHEATEAEEVRLPRSGNAGAVSPGSAEEVAAGRRTANDSEVPEPTPRSESTSSRRTISPSRERASLASQVQRKLQPQPARSAFPRQPVDTTSAVHETNSSSATASEPHQSDDKPTLTRPFLINPYTR